MKTKSEFSFKALEIPATKAMCAAPVAATVRKSNTRWVIFRIDKKTAKATQFANGTLLTPFVDEQNRALLFLSDQRPPTGATRRCYVKDGCCYVEFPRKELLETWFPVGPIRPMHLFEASHGRLVIQVPRI